MALKVIKCKISLPVLLSEEKQDPLYAESVLQDLKAVPTNGNAILHRIMEAKSSWAKSPIVWVDNFPYKIKVIQQTQNRAVMFQMAIKYTYKTNGKETYQVLSKRKVAIEYI